jgi:hypothetical protein
MLRAELSLDSNPGRAEVENGGVMERGGVFITEMEPLRPVASKRCTDGLEEDLRRMVPVLGRREGFLCAVRRARAASGS